MSFKFQRIRAGARFGLCFLVAGILLWPAVSLAAPGSVPRSEGGKLQRVLDRRTEVNASTAS